MNGARKIRVGLLGVNADRGWANVAHIPALRQLDGYEIVAIGNRNLVSARAAADKFGVPMAFGDASELILCPDVDVVVVTVRVTEHERLVRMAIEAGKHVYCEWPLGVSLAEAQALADLADRAGVRTVIGLQGHWSAGARAVRRFIDEGVIGRPTAVSVMGAGGPHGPRTPQAYAYALAKASGANILSVSTAHWLAALEVAVGPLLTVASMVVRVNDETVIAETGERVSVTAPDQVALTGLLSSGALLSVAVHSGVAPGVAAFEARITGTEGSLSISPAGPGSFHMANWSITLARIDGTRDVLTVPDQDLPPGIAPGPPRNVAGIYRELASAMAERRRAEPDFRTAVHFHRLVETIEHASASGTHVAVPLERAGGIPAGADGY